MACTEGTYTDMMGSSACSQEDYTCHDIKVDYRSSNCCGHPNNPFRLSPKPRRLSAGSTGFLSAIRLALQRAQAEGGSAQAKRLKAAIEDATRAGTGTEL